MKTVLRLLVLATAFVLIMSACTAQEDEVVPEYTVGGSDVADFEGREFVILQEKFDEDEAIYMYKPDSLYYDMMKAHVSNIENWYDLLRF